MGNDLNGGDQRQQDGHADAGRRREGAQGLSRRRPVPARREPRGEHCRRWRRGTRWRPHRHRAPSPARCAARASREAGWGYGVRARADGGVRALLHLPVRLRDLHQLLPLGDPREEPASVGTQLRDGAPRPDLPHGAQEHADYTVVVVPLEMALGLSLALIVNAGDPRQDVLPLGVLLPVDRLVGRDHDDRPLHLQRQRSVQSHLRRQHAVVQRREHGDSGRSSA